MQRVTLLTADQTRSGPQNPDVSPIRNLLIRCLLTTVPWSCDWHVLEPGLQGLPQPLTEVAFLPTLSPRLLTLGGQTFHMPLSCQHQSGSSSHFGIELLNISPRAHEMHAKIPCRGATGNPGIRPGRLHPARRRVSEFSAGLGQCLWRQRMSKQRSSVTQMCNLPACTSQERIYL